jgi:hypothetical protein
MKNLLIISAILIAFTCNAQLGNTKAEIVEQYGTNYTSDRTSDDNILYILYDIPINQGTENEYMRGKVFYFQEVNETLQCHLFANIDPINQINMWVKHLNSKYVPSGDMRWLDYTDYSVCTIQVDEGIVSVLWKYLD